MSIRIDRIQMVVEMTKKDLKITELARLTGLSRSTIQSVKCGKSCNPVTAKRLAAVLGAEIIKEA